MKKIVQLVSVLVLTILIFGGLATPALAQNTQNFRITNFEADYYLDKDENDIATMRVRESITALFPEFDQNRGILRAIPKTYLDNDVSLKILSVTDQNNSPYQYTSSTENDNLVLRIGDPNKFVRGETTYIIEYQIKNVINFQETHSELYWDVNGDQWPQPTDRVTARVHIPAAIAQDLQPRNECFANTINASGRTCNVSTQAAEDGQLVTISTTGLGPRSTLTFVLGFDEGVFQPDHAALVARRIVMVLHGIGLIGIPLLTAGYVYHRWRKSGRDPKGKGVIVPQFTPPKDINIIMANVIVNEHVNSRGTTAAIIDLAVSGYIAIHETTQKGLIGKISKSKEYELELTHLPDKMDAELKKVITMLFGTAPTPGKRVSLSSLKSTLYKDVKALDKQAGRKVFGRGYFANNPATARKSYATITVVLAVFAGLLLFFLPTFAIGLGLSAFLFGLSAKYMPARTQNGVETKEYLLGMRDYIKLAEADRLSFLQSPEGVRQYGDPTKPENQVKLFEKLLPYAVLFGIEKSWAKEFEQVYTEPPTWYSGTGNFSAIYLASSLSGFSSSAASSFSPPSSSGGGSGFSGGGFSGGGGGGGGGGGW